MKTSNSFALSKMTDTDLTNLFNACASEMAKREEARRERRSKWITNHYWAFMGHPNASVLISEKRTIVAIYNHYDGVRIGTAYPINGDTYDHDTGIAVAYAKALGERIPNYI